MAINQNGGGRGADGPQIDAAYEFFAPRFFDFLNEETEEEIQRAERWFQTSLSYNPSPFMPRIKVGRSVQIDGLCDFGNVEQTQKDQEPAGASNERNDPMPAAKNIERAHDLATTKENAGHLQESKDGKVSFEFVPKVKPCNDSTPPQVETSSFHYVNKETSSFEFPVLTSADNLARNTEAYIPKTRMALVQGTTTCLKNQTASASCTPKAQRALHIEAAAPSKNQTPKRIDGQIRQPSALKPKPKSTNTFLGSTATKDTMATDIAQENQAIKRQKLDVGRSRQILDVKSRVLPHKSKPGLTGGTSLFTSTVKKYKEAEPFMSTAEMVRKFQTKTREVDLSHNRSLSHHDTVSLIQRRPKLTLTRPKGPELETSHRVRAVRVKSSAELEEEILANMPKFKARPVNKKILDAPTLPALSRSAPQPPEFQEFHLKTMERASQHAETSSSVASTKESSVQNRGKPLKLAEPRRPNLETALRARPPRIKSSWELQLEELEKIPKFKARPLNKKILESKGDLGLFINPKPELTTPQEFHFATNERMGPPAAVTELFDKLSMHSEPHQGQNEVPRVTIPNPFHLHTYERGIEKEKQFAGQILQKQLEEERARIPKSNPYPYTTDYPVVPPKIEPKQCTKPEAFQLESLVRHEDEMQKKLDEKQRMEKEETQRRIFKAQPIMKDDPLPLPERERKPLTQVQEFGLHVDYRVVARSEFDKKIKEKEIMYKRLREEHQSAQMIEEKKAVKRLRMTAVPNAGLVPKFSKPFLQHK